MLIQKSASSFYDGTSTSDWKQVGQDLDGEAAYHQFGFLVSLSADVTLAARANQNDGNNIRNLVGTLHDTTKAEISTVQGRQCAFFCIVSTQIQCVGW